MGTFYSQNDYRNYLEHFGVKGMKWGVRRYQNANGSYTSAGRKRYGVGNGQPYKAVKGGGARNTAEAKAARRAKLKKAAIAVGGAAALAGAGYLAYKYGKNTRAGQYVRNAGIANAARARYMLEDAKGAASRAGAAASRAGRYAHNASIAGAANARQAGRNATTAAMRTAGAVYNAYEERRRRRR